jgi:transketolase
MEPLSDFMDLCKKAKDIRKSIILSLAEAGSGHLGGSLGLADIFTFLYFNELKHDPENPHWPERDRLILSIGHVAPVLYASLAHAGYFPVEELLTLRKLNSRLQGHPGKDHGLPGIEISSGSLGQGLSVAVGIALANKLDKKENRVFSICGDGELQEGSIWEATMSASHYKLDNLVAIVDRNFCQIDGRTNNVMELEPLSLKWASFGWHVITCDGNNFRELAEAFGEAQEVIKQPSVIIAQTIMGKGIHSIENDYRWHGKVPTQSQAIDFISELDKPFI